MGEIYQLLPRVMHDVGSISKGRRNEKFAFDFRGIDDVLNYVNPALVKNNVSLTYVVRDWKLDVQIETIERRNEAPRKSTTTRATLMMDVTFSAPDGSYVTSSAPGEALDYGGDKATTKAQAAAFKYIMFLTLCIPVDRKSIDDADDHDSYTEPPPEPEAKQSAKKPPAGKQKGAPVKKPDDGPQLVPDETQEIPPKTADNPAEAVSLYTRLHAKITNFTTVQQCNDGTEFVDLCVREGKLTAAQSKSLGATINKQAKKINTETAKGIIDDPNNKNAK